MSEKIIVLHPENQPEVDIYPIIKEGSIPNSVIDNQKIKSRTIINSNIALNTLKYEVLHSTLKQLIDSKITQANMENYLTSYYYNVEETQQYVGSEINTLHQTIRNEFYSKTAIDDMLLEKTDLSLFRQYLPSTYLNLDKQQDNQTSKLNIHANGSIFLMNSGNKTNSGNYYLPNSIVKTEDAPNGYFVLSTTNDDYQSLYNLGAYDKITTNDDGRYTITRQTGYIDLGSLKWIYDSNNNQFYSNEIVNAYNENNTWISVVCNTYTYNIVDYNDLHTPHIRGFFDKRLYVVDETLNQNGELITGVIQYKLATSYTEKVEKNHYARYNQDFILEHNKSEAERSANLFDDNGTNSIQYIGHYFISSSYNLSPQNDYNCFRIRVEQNKTYYIKQIGELILRYEDINNNLVGGNANFYQSGYGAFTTPNGCNYVVFSKAISYTNNVMLNKGSTPLPYQPYEGKTIHEKDLETSLETKQDKLESGVNIKKINGNDILGSGNITIGTIPIFGVSQLYKHDYELEAKPSDDTIYVTCWSTKPDKILLEDITRYAFSNIQVYNSGNNETIQVIKWASTGFNYINNDGNIDGMGYIVLHYYINSEPTPY